MIHVIKYGTNAAFSNLFTLYLCVVMQEKRGVGCFCVYFIVKCENRFRKDCY